MNEKVYIAGPMTGIPHHNVPAFDAARDYLQSCGYDPVSPPDITRRLADRVKGIHSDGTIEPEAYCLLVRKDFEELLECKSVYVLPGWRESRGAKLEVALAIQLGLPIYDYKELKKLNIQILTTVVP